MPAPPVTLDRVTERLPETVVVSGDAAGRIVQLDERECWQRLLGSATGRLAFRAGGRIEILPLNYVVQGETLLFRTTEGASLLTEQRLDVSFEVDGWDSRGSWSVVAHGSIARSDDPAAAPLGGAPWPAETGARSVAVRFTVAELTGREFERVRLPDLLWSW